MKKLCIYIGNIELTRKQFQLHAPSIMSIVKCQKNYCHVERRRHVMVMVMVMCDYYFYLFNKIKKISSKSLQLYYKQKQHVSLQSIGRSYNRIVMQFLFYVSGGNG